MTTDTTIDTTEINTFEEYTLYSLDQSRAGVFSMMERSKMIANCWPEVGAMVGMADLCKEVAALACFQHSLCETLGAIDGEDGKRWTNAVDQIRCVMNSLEEALDVHDAHFVENLFGVDLPASLNSFAECIPVLSHHVRSLISSGDSDAQARDAVESA